MCVLLPQYSVPVVKYDRNGFRPRLRQLIFTQEAAYLVEEAKIKQRIDYNSLKGKCVEDVSAGGLVDMLPTCYHTRLCFHTGVSVSNLSDNFLILHVTCDDIKQKVETGSYQQTPDQM